MSVNAGSSLPAGRPCSADGYLLPDHWIVHESQPYHSAERLYRFMSEAYVARVVDLLIESGARRVLEAGCGDGWNCGRLVKANLETVGVDCNANAIDHAARLVPAGRFICGDITNPQLLEQLSPPFDAAILIEVIEHIPPDKCAQALQNLRDCLKTGGSLVVTTPSTNIDKCDPTHYRHFSEQLLRETIEETGTMRVKWIEGYGNALFERWYYRLARFFDNRFYLIKPIRSWLQRYYRKHATQSPLGRCHGLLAVVEASEYNLMAGLCGEKTSV